ncbi:MAG: hypothetical protein ACXVB9_04320, partial [Bdellovibrionota bacterium]
LAGLFMGDGKRVWEAFLVYHSLSMGLAIGAIFFLVIHYLAAAGWNVGIRRVTEGYASYFFVAAIFNVVLLIGQNKIYPWSNLEFMNSSKVLQGKIGYFSTGFFSARVLVFTAVVFLLAWQILGNSTKQDEEGGVELSNRQKPLSALFLVLFAPLMTMFSVDVIKSLDPKWFSTMFGVYVFIGFVQASSAMTIVTVYQLKKAGYLTWVTDDHYHDMGKYLFGWSIFWAYIGVSQYLLIWYANLPEEITFYLQRQTPGWVWFQMLMPTLRFVLPFLLLLPRAAKRNPKYLVKVAYIVLFGAWLDVYLMIMPNYSPESFGFSFLYDIGLFLGFTGILIFTVRRFLSRNLLLPIKDPHVHETLHHHVM